MAERLLQPTVITDGGPWAEHDMPCAVCRVRPAVLNLNVGMFEPCWTCQEQGFRLVYKRRRLGDGRRIPVPKAPPQSGASGEAADG